jgi:hypothetical protein
MSLADLLTSQERYEHHDYSCGRENGFLLEGNEVFIDFFKIVADLMWNRES